MLLCGAPPHRVYDPCLRVRLESFGCRQEDESAVSFTPNRESKVDGFFLQFIAHPPHPLLLPCFHGAIVYTGPPAFLLCRENSVIIGLSRA